MAGGYPLILVNPQRPHAQFTEQYGGTQGTYATPTGGTIGFDELRRYVLSGLPSPPSAADVKTAQAALGLPETGELDADTMAGISNIQVMYGLPPTGAPDAATLAKIAEVLRGGGGDRKKRRDSTSDYVTLAVVLLLAKFVLFRGE